MSIRFESDKCWVSNPEGLRIKRFLSDTRSYFREGSWIQGHFSYFFPGINVDAQGCLFYDLKTLQPPLTAVKAACLQDTRLPGELIEQLQLAIDQFQAHTSKGGLNFNEEVSSREFSLPDPEMHPELYWVAETSEGLRLVILWGLQSEADSANIRVEELPERLYTLFEGRLSLKKISTPHDRETSDPPVADNHEQMSHAPSTRKVGRQASDIEKMVSPPIPADPTGAPQDSAVPSRSVRKSLIKRVFSIIFLILLSLAGFTELSMFRLGSDVEMKAEPLQPIRNANRITFPLHDSETAILYDGTEIHGSETITSVSINQFLKPGEYPNEIIDSTSGELKRTWTASYSPVLNDMANLPVASLHTVSGKAQVLTGQPVQFLVHHSFGIGESTRQPLQYQLSWGEVDNPFVAVDATSRNQPLSHAYTHPGSYKVTLLVIDSEGNWDHDQVQLVVENEGSQVLDRAPNFPPQVVAQIVSILPHQDSQIVTLDLSDSFDPDGDLEQLWIDWGDGSDPQSTQYPSLLISHTYRRSHNRINIRVEAQDEQGVRSAKPASLFLDFQSAEMNDVTRYGAQVDPFPEDTRLVAGESGQLGLKVHTWKNLYLNKKRFRFALQNPISLPYQPLLNPQWTLLQSPGNRTFQVKNRGEIELMLIEGSYVLTAQAETLDGDILYIEHRFTVVTAREMDLLTKTMDWWVRKIPYLSVSHYLPSKNDS